MSERDDIRKRSVRLDLKVWFWLVAAGVFFMLVNVSSLQIEAVRDGAPAPGLWPWLTEGSSVLATLAIYPFLAYLARHIIVSSETWRRALIAHVLGSMVFSAVHISLMVGLRKLAYPVFLDRHYAFFGNIMREIVYEYRKDLATYFLIISALYVVRALAQQSRELEAMRKDAKKTGRLALKCGARTIHIKGEDFVYGESAGNYVDVYTICGQHLVRSSLSALQKQLQAAGIVALRIHRTRLVNADAIGETTPIGSGDVRLTLRGGATIRASRRYRKTLDRLAQV